MFPFFELLGNPDKWTRSTILACEDVVTGGGVVRGEDDDRKKQQIYRSHVKLARY